MRDNKVNLIEPLKERLSELEQMVQNKEQKVKKNYRRKLRKCRKELENEKKINLSLAKRICLINPNDRSISEVEHRNHKNAKIYYNDMKQSKSQLGRARSRGRFNQFNTQINLKKYQDSRTIDTPEREKEND